MADNELLGYIKRVKKMGHNDQTIVEHLKKHGYPEHIIDDAFNQLNKKLDLLFIIMIGLVSVLVILGGIFLFSKIKSMNLFAPNPICLETNISIYQIDTQSSACIFADSSRIQLMIENTGQKDIEKLDFIIAGTKTKMHDALIDLQIKPTDVFPKVINYNPDEYGDFKSITIKPFVKDNDKLISCQAIEIKELRKC
ncbi:hypothetical protein JW930_01225 [Candidatus Woesearchaeota archaeon]|nr:hypothetical protein [Candidatus Woesearchaeota archaeon]